MPPGMEKRNNLYTSSSQLRADQAPNPQVDIHRPDGCHRSIGVKHFEQLAH